MPNLAILCNISKGDTQDEKMKKALENYGMKGIV